MNGDDLLEFLKKTMEFLSPYVEGHMEQIQLAAKIGVLFLAPFLLLLIFLSVYKRLMVRFLEKTTIPSLRFKEKEIVSSSTITGFLKATLELIRIATIIWIYYFFFNWILELFPGPLAGRIISIVRGLALTVITLISGTFLYRSIKFVFHKSRFYVRNSRGKYFKSIRIHRVVLLTERRLEEILLGLLRFLELASIVFLFYIIVPIAFSFFDFTSNWASALFGYILAPLKTIVKSIFAYIPNLFFILVSLLVGRYIIRFIRFLAREIEAQRIELKSFEPEWVTPSYKIIRFLVIVFLAIVIYPYLPGSDTEAFKGISIFLGLLFSLGSSTAIANTVAGVILTYMLPFRIGDRVKIGDTTGDVIEKTLLVTRIRTIKNVVITIPNSSVLGNSILNYTSSRDHGGLILHTAITLGYDVPWRKVNRTLIAAALDTEGIRSDPSPFILQTELGDFSVAYELNAYTDEPGKMAVIMSRLHEQIQDHCARAGIEILSPHYRTVRHDSTSTIPAVEEMRDPVQGTRRPATSKKKRSSRNPILE